MKIFVLRGVAALLAVLMMLGAVGCQPDEPPAVESFVQGTASTAPTVPSKPTVPVTLTLPDPMMTMDLSSMTELVSFIGTTVSDTTATYVVKDNDHDYTYLLTLTHSGDTIQKAVIAVGDTEVVLRDGEFRKIAAGCLAIRAAAEEYAATTTVPTTAPTSPAAKTMTMEDLLTLNFTDINELNQYSYTAVDATHRSYVVVNPEHDNQCTLSVTMDEAATVTAATLSYGDLVTDLLANHTVAYLEIYSAMTAE